MQFYELILVLGLMVLPLAAIVGGITAGILKSNARHRMIELAQRERIVALERGIDPERLPKIELPGVTNDNGTDMTFEQRQLRRSQALRIWGFIATGFGGALLFGIAMSDGYREAAPASIFVGVGLALILSGLMVRPKKEDVAAEGRRHS
jgi:hypothetical protein